MLRSRRTGCLTVAESCSNFTCNESKALYRVGGINDDDDDDNDGDSIDAGGVDGGVNVDVDGNAGKDDTDGNCIGGNGFQMCIRDRL